MTRKRALTLLGLTGLFGVLTAVLVFQPQLTPYLFASFGFLFIVCDWLEETEIPIVFAFLALFAGLFSARALPDGGLKFAVGVEFASMLVLFYGALSLYRSRLNRERYRVQVEMIELDQQIRERDRDIKFYEKYKQNISTQIRLRQDFSEAAQSLGGTMDLAEIKARLLRTLSKNFPDAHVELLSGVPKDPLEQWAAQQRLPVLVPDIQNDERFRTFHMSYPFRSIMVVPVQVLHQPVGFLRIEHEKASAFQTADLRSAELYATLASLSMENVRLFEQIQELAVKDGLTQLYTHRAFQTRMAEEILTAGRTNSPLGFILCDIDHFKKYNDTFGHQAGDLLLKTVSAILVQSVRDIDYVARYGGEEFALILPNMDKAQASQVAEGIRKRVEAEQFVFNGQPSKVTMSFGVSSFPADATTQSQLIRCGDERLYKCKSGGRNMVCAQ